LSEALWAHKVSRHGATKTTHYELVYGQAVVLPVKINFQACRVDKQEALSTEEYTEYMIEHVDKVRESRLNALREIQKEKIRVVKAYNKLFVAKSFQVGDLVWKMILPVGKRDNRFGK
jgi:hypothetical protein